MRLIEMSTRRNFFEEMSTNLLYGKEVLLNELQELEESKEQKDLLAKKQERAATSRRGVRHGLGWQPHE